jgi:Zn-dependent protease with chaperone function
MSRGERKRRYGSGRYLFPAFLALGGVGVLLAVGSWSTLVAAAGRLLAQLGDCRLCCGERYSAAVAWRVVMKLPPLFWALTAVAAASAWGLTAAAWKTVSGWLRARRIQACLDGLAGRSRRETVWVRRNLGTPALTLGWWRPRTYLSAAASRGVSRDAMEAVLVHEKWHRSRRDPLRSLAASAVQAFLFFVPGTRRLLRRFRIQQELEADAAAARALGDPRPVREALEAFGPRGTQDAGRRSRTLPTPVSVGLATGFLLLWVLVVSEGRGVGAQMRGPCQAMVCCGQGTGQPCVP